MIKRELHWRKMEAKRALTGNLPAHAFNFISIHFNERDNNYSMISPLCICESNGMKRPLFEKDKYTILKQVKRAANINAAFYTAETGINIFVVDCRD